MSTEIVKIEDLASDPKNSRVHPESNRLAIQASLSRFGAGRSIVLDGSNTVRAGNGTLDAARLEGFREVLIVDPKPGQLVAVRRTDWTDAQAAAYAIADNRTGDSSYFAEESLLEALGGLPDDDRHATGFSEDEISAMLEEAASCVAGPLGGKGGREPSGDGENREAPQYAPESPRIAQDATIDGRLTELASKWQTAPGQLWEVPSVATPGQSHWVIVGQADDILECEREGRIGCDHEARPDLAADLLERLAKSGLSPVRKT